MPDDKKEQKKRSKSQLILVMVQYITVIISYPYRDIFRQKNMIFYSCHGHCGNRQDQVATGDINKQRCRETGIEAISVTSPCRLASVQQSIELVATVCHTQRGHVLSPRLRRHSLTTDTSLHVAMSIHQSPAIISHATMTVIPVGNESCH